MYVYRAREEIGVLNLETQNGDYLMYDGLQQLVDVIGLEASLRLIAAWGSLTLYVPGEFDGDHLITKILGEDAASTKHKPRSDHEHKTKF